MSTDTTTTAGHISLDIPAVPLHKVAAKDRGRYGMCRVSLVQMPQGSRGYWALDHTSGRLNGWDGWTIQATDGRALVILPVFLSVVWDSPADAALDLPIGRWSWDAKEYGRLVGKKAKARYGFHRLEFKGDLLAERGRWVSETAGGVVEGIRGDAGGEWPRTEAVLPPVVSGGCPDSLIGLDADYLATLQACVNGPVSDQVGVRMHLTNRMAPIVVTGPIGFGVLMPVTTE